MCLKGGDGVVQGSLISMPPAVDRGRTRDGQWQSNAPRVQRIRDQTRLRFLERKLRLSSLSPPNRVVEQGLSRREQGRERNAGEDVRRAGGYGEQRTEMSWMRFESGM